MAKVCSPWSNLASQTRRWMRGEAARIVFLHCLLKRAPPSSLLPTPPLYETSASDGWWQLNIHERASNPRARWTFSPHRPGSGIGFLRGGGGWGLFQAGAQGQLNQEPKGHRTCMMSPRVPPPLSENKNSDALGAHGTSTWNTPGFWCFSLKVKVVWKSWSKLTWIAFSSRNSLKVRIMRQTFPRMPRAHPVHRLANRKLQPLKSDRLTVHTHTHTHTHTQTKHTLGSLLRRMDVATKCTTFCSSQGLVRAPVNWEAILIFPLFMLWLWDYPFSHSFLKTTREIPPSPFLSVFSFFHHPPTPLLASPPTHTHLYTHQHSSRIYPPRFHSQVPPWPWKL